MRTCRIGTRNPSNSPEFGLPIICRLAKVYFHDFRGIWDEVYRSFTDALPVIFSWLTARSYPEKASRNSTEAACSGLVRDHRVPDIGGGQGVVQRSRIRAADRVAGYRLQVGDHLGRGSSVIPKGEPPPSARRARLRDRRDGGMRPRSRGAPARRRRVGDWSGGGTFGERRNEGGARQALY